VLGARIYSLLPLGSGMSGTPSSKALFNLQRTNILLADGDAMGQSILAQMLAGFGARNIVRAEDVTELRRQLASGTFDLIIMDPSSFGPEGYDIIPWLRRTIPPPRAHAPIIVVTGHTEHSRVGQLRDGGANFIVSKPLSAAVMMERLLWLARENRPFVETNAYAGPDRRWHDAPLAAGVEGRRQKDRELAVRIAAGGDMNQADIDLIMTTPMTMGSAA
jgi:CheY-like chemotaxis protein